MGRVLQTLRHARRLTAAEEQESRMVFALAIGCSKTVGSDSIELHDAVMTLPQLRLCLRALGFALAQGEARELAYEFDFDNSDTLRLADFQKIFLFKTLERSNLQRFHEAFRAVAGRETTMRVSDLNGQIEDKFGSDKRLRITIDPDTLVNHLQAQYYEDDDVEVAMESEAEYIRSTGRVTCDSLAHFLRIQ